MENSFKHLADQTLSEEDEQFKKRMLENLNRLKENCIATARMFEDLAKQKGIELKVTFLKNGENARIYQIKNGKKLPIKRSELHLLPIDKKSTIIFLTILNSYCRIARRAKTILRG